MALSIAIAAASAVGGSLAAWHYHRLGLTLAHYDARGHLVVARRIIDSITPGWQQIGAVWLPLPHLLNMLPVQIDRFYQTGASAVAVSVGSYVIASGAIAWIVFTVGENRGEGARASQVGGARAFQASDSVLPPLAAATVFALNPNVIYLQSTPLTEPLLLAATTIAIATLIAWCECDAGSKRTRPTHEPIDAKERTRRPGPFGPGDDGPRDDGPGNEGPFGPGGRRVHPGAVGLAFALASLTRYEAWPVTASALAAAAWTRWRRGDDLTIVWRSVGSIVLYPAAAIAGFAIYSRVVVGQWFVGTDFFVPENKARGDWWLAAKEIGWGIGQLSGTALAAIGLAGIAIAAIRVASVSARRDRSAKTSALQAGAPIILSFATMAVIPLVAFYEGHPFRIRYMVPLIAAEAIGAGTAAAALPSRRARALGAAAVLAVAAYSLRPLDASSPMVAEAQWDAPNVADRARVTRCIGTLEPGAKIMASMGSLGHYMQDASRSGLAVRDFLHEGNGDIWLAALEQPLPFADWILIEEKAQGGDMLAKIARNRPEFLAGYERECEGAGTALYRRQNLKLTVNE
jgi:hypothetical protein